MSEQEQEIEQLQSEISELRSQLASSNAEITRLLDLIHEFNSAVRKQKSSMKRRSWFSLW